MLKARSRGTGEGGILPPAVILVIDIQFEGWLNSPDQRIILIGQGEGQRPAKDKAVDRVPRLISFQAECASDCNYNRP